MCDNKFTVDVTGIDMRKKNGEYVQRIACKGCLRRLKTAIAKLEAKHGKK